MVSPRVLSIHSSLDATKTPTLDDLVQSLAETQATYTQEAALVPDGSHIHDMH
jgi:hypothetical protein